MAVHPMGVIVTGLFCLGVNAVVMTAMGSAKGEDALAAQSVAEVEVDTVKNRYEKMGDLRFECARADGEACHALGRAYETREDLWGRPVKGDGVKRDDRKAAHYFRLACDLGQKDSCGDLGRLYETGKGVAQNSVEAARYYHKACALGASGRCEKVSAPAIRD